MKKRFKECKSSALLNLVLFHPTFKGANYAADTFEFYSLDIHRSLLARKIVTPTSRGTKIARD